MLSLSGPLLGAVVGAAAGLLLVIFVIVMAVKLRYRPRSQEDKDSHDDGGMANLAASGTGASSPRDKSATLPLSADSIESFEKDPDIIPHANGRREPVTRAACPSNLLVCFLRSLGLHNKRAPPRKTNRALLVPRYAIALDTANSL